MELTDITDTDMQTGMKEMKKEDLVSMRCVWRWYWKRERVESPGQRGCQIHV